MTGRIRHSQSHARRRHRANLRTYRRGYFAARDACMAVTREKGELALALWDVKAKLTEAKQRPLANLRVPLIERLRLAWRVLCG